MLTYADVCRYRARGVFWWRMVQIEYLMRLTERTKRLLNLARARQDANFTHPIIGTCIRQHNSAYVSIRQHTSTYLSLACARQDASFTHPIIGLPVRRAYVSIRQHTSAYVANFTLTAS